MQECDGGFANCNDDAADGSAAFTVSAPGVISRLVTIAEVDNDEQALVVSTTTLTGFAANAQAAAQLAAKQTDGITAVLEKVETYRQAGDYDTAMKTLKDCGNFENVSAEYHYQMGKLLDAQGEVIQAFCSHDAHELDMCRR